MFRNAFPLSMLFAAVALSPATAGTVTYDVALNTSSLAGHTATPFSLEFQFNDGSGWGDGNNTATLSSFSFGTGGGLVGAPSSVGGVTGDASSTVLMADTSFFNQFIQEFTPGGILSFRLSLSTNLDMDWTPDEFTFAILDGTGTELPTRSPFYDVFAQIDLDSNNPTIQTFASDGTRAPAAGGIPLVLAAPQSVMTPEPSYVPFFLLGAFGLFFPARLRRKRV